MITKLTLIKGMKDVISAQIDALRNIRIDQKTCDAVNVLANMKGKLVVSGVGKSGNIGIKIAATFSSLSIPAMFMHPVEAFHGDIGSISSDDVVLALSYSGSTKELIKFVQAMKKRLIPVVVITGLDRSMLGKLADYKILCTVKEEGSPHNLAPMASTTATLACGDVLAFGTSVLRGFKKDDFAQAHPSGALGLELTLVKEIMHRGLSIPRINKDATVRKVLQEISKKKLGVTAVVDKNKLQGVISDGDVRRFLQSNNFSLEIQANIIMTKNPKVISKEKTLKETLNFMEENKITSLFVVDKLGRIEGIVHMHDIIEYTF